MSDVTGGNTPSSDASQPSSYPGAPMPGAYPGPGAPTPATRPSTIANAVKLMYVGAVLSGLGVLIAFTIPGTVRTQLEDQGGFTSTEINAAIAFGVATAVAIAALGVALWILNAVFNGKGKKWARILSTVLGVLSIIFFLIGLADPTPLSIISNLLQAGLAVAILWLLWRPESSRYYDAMSA